MKILIAYGTRPEWIKVKPLIDEIDNRGFNDNPIDYRTLLTGQHDMLKNHVADYHLTISNDEDVDRLSNIFSSVVSSTSKILNKEKFTHVLVQGDTTSAVAVAVAAFHNKVKVIHLEAGLRTYDKENPFPEEVNRRMISEIADIHFCPTKYSYDNLNYELIKGNLYVVGNTALDNLVEYQQKCEYGDVILVTMHRRENHEILDKWFTEINNLAKSYPYYKFVLPLHPNPNVQKFKYLLSNVEVVEPLDHEKLLNLLVKTRLVITDSGGLQEECSFFNKKCLVCRTETERPEALGYSSFLVKSPELLKSLFIEHIDSYMINYESPYGNGTSSKQIVDIFVQLENEKNS